MDLLEAKEEISNVTTIESIVQDSVGNVSVVDSIDTTSLNFIQESMLNVYRKGYIFTFMIKKKDTVVRTNKGQITFFRKIYWALIRDKYFGKNFYQAKCRFFI